MALVQRKINKNDVRDDVVSILAQVVHDELTQCLDAGANFIEVQTGVMTALLMTQLATISRGIRGDHPDDQIAKIMEDVVPVYSKVYQQAMSTLGDGLIAKQDEISTILSRHGVAVSFENRHSDQNGETDGASGSDLG